MTKVETERLVHLCLDEQGLQQKPDDGHTIGKIVNRLPERAVDIPLRVLAKEITLPYAKSFNPAVFKESMHQSKPEKGCGLWMQNEGWAKQQVVAVDIDEGLSFVDAIARCQKYRLEPAFVYTSFSETNLDKFRLVFCLPEPIEDIQIQKLIISSLVDFIFPEADPKCRNPSRFFYGGKSIIYENYSATIDVHEIIDAVCHFLTDRDSSNANKKILDYCKAVGLNTVNNKPGIIKRTFSVTEVENSSPTNQEYTKSLQYLYLYNRFCYGLVNFYTLRLVGERLKQKSNITKEPKYNISDEKIVREKLRNIKPEAVLEKCKLTREFVAGKYWAYHGELFGLATNLLSFQGGKKLFEQGLSSRPEYGTEEGKFKKQDFISYFINQINKSNYNPEWCKEYCSFESYCTHLSTIIETVGINRGEVKELVKPFQIVIGEAESRLAEAFNDCQESDKRISIIKAETGLGKTEAYVKSGIKKCVYAVPTHKLKDEVAERFWANGITVEVTPEVPELLEHEELKRERYYQMGAHEKAAQYLFKLSKKNDDYADKINTYYEELKRVMASDEIIITTHERAILSFQEYDGPIIFDEDPIESQLKINQVSIEDLKLLRKAITEIIHMYADFKLYKLSNEIIEYLDELPDDEYRAYYWDEPNFTFFKNLIVNYIVTVKSILYKRDNLYHNPTNIFEFFKCSFFIKKWEHIHYVNRRELPGKKVIIMSATASEFIYKKMYGDDLQFVEIPKAETKGRLVQYPRYSLSRAQLKKNPIFLDDIRSIVSEDKVITYKAFKESFFNCVGTYGAVRGLDWLKGEDITIVGTPHVNQIYYYLMGLGLGIEYTDEEAQMQYKNIEYNGFSFYFYTFTKSDALKEIQMWKIGSEIEQAVGRSRILREECTVTIFSNFPIQGAAFREIRELEDWTDTKGEEEEQDESFFKESDNEDMLAI